MRSQRKHVNEMVLYSVLLKVVKGLHYCSFNVFGKLDTKGRQPVTRQRNELKMDLCMNSGVLFKQHIVEAYPISLAHGMKNGFESS